MTSTISLSKDKSIVTLTIEVPFKGNSLVYEKYHCSDALKMVEAAGFIVIECIQNSMVSNTRPEDCKGQWQFRVVTPVPVKEIKPKRIISSDKVILKEAK